MYQYSNYLTTNDVKSTSIYTNNFTEAYLDGFEFKDKYLEYSEYPNKIWFKKIKNNGFDPIVKLNYSKAYGATTTINFDYVGTNATTIYDWEYEWRESWTKETAEEKLKRKISQIIKDRCSPNIVIRQNSKRNPLPMTSDVREQRARETLRRVIGEQKFINFVKNGFISVKGKSGLVYQIFTGHGITHVFNQGELVDRLCVVLQGKFPPTDSLIMRYLLILNNEQQFRNLSIKHSITTTKTELKSKKCKSLLEIFKETKLSIAV